MEDFEPEGQSTMVIKYHTEGFIKPTSSNKVFVGRIIHSKSLKHLEILPNATVGVKSDGSIAFVEENTSLETKIGRAHV